MIVTLCARRYRCYTLLHRVALVQVALVLPAFPSLVVKGGVLRNNCTVVQLDDVVTRAHPVAQSCSVSYNRPTTADGTPTPTPWARRQRTWPEAERKRAKE
jgi:hypothetical protein